MSSEECRGDYLPLVRIDLRQGKSEEYKRLVGETVYRAMVDGLGVPENDRFQVITEHAESAMIFDPLYPGIERSPNYMFVQITLNAGRTVEKKQRFYKILADALHESAGVRREDVFISLVEVPKENWSFGSGIAQYATPE